MPCLALVTLFTGNSTKHDDKDTSATSKIDELQICLAHMSRFKRTKEKSPVGIAVWKRIINAIISLCLLGLITAVGLRNEANNCPVGFKAFLPYRGQCYAMLDGYHDFFTANNSCQSKGGYLLEIYTESETVYIGQV